MTSPFITANQYRAKGWEGTLPIPYGAKFPPPRGYTGKNGKMPTEAEVTDWQNRPDAFNIALRLPAGIVGFDVDAYEEKKGIDTIQRLEEDLGPLPSTWRCSSRDDGVSGIRLYSVPEDLGHVSDLGPGVEVCQLTYRYVVAPPSLHPAGNTYLWYHDNEQSLAPNISEVPALPEKWVKYLRERQNAQYTREQALINRPKVDLQGKALAAAKEYSESYLKAKIDKMLELPSKGTTVLWDQTVFGVARDLVRLTNSWWCTVTHEEARTKFEEACGMLEDGTKWDDEMLDKWVRAQAEVTEEMSLPAEVERARQNRIPLDATNDATYEDLISELIGTGALSNIFQRGTELIKFKDIGESGYTVPVSDAPDIPAYSLVTSSNLVSLIDRYYWVYRQEKKDRVHALAPLEATRRAIERSMDFDALRQVRVLTRTPLVRRNGQVMSTPGYDPDEKAMYLPLYQNSNPPMTFSSANAAREWLLSEKGDEGIFGQVPYVDHDSRATFLAMLLTPLMELICPAPWPLFALTAPDRGSGKSLLAQSATILYGGTVRGMASDKEEFRKAVTTILTGTVGKIVTFDNVENTVVNEELSRLLTEHTWTDRMLGQNRNVSVPNDRLWCLTGNNIMIGDDQRRRTVWIQIDANTEKPWERTGFREKDLKGWLRNNWETVLAALAKMITDWIKAGQPMDTATVDRYDEFGQWVRVMNGILAHSKATGRVGRTERVEGLVENDIWNALFAEIGQRYKGETWTVRKIGEDFRFKNLLDQIVPVEQKNFTIKFGRLLLKRENQWFSGIRLVRGQRKNNTVQWKLESKDGWDDEPVEPISYSLGVNKTFNKLLDM